MNTQKHTHLVCSEDMQADMETVGRKSIVHIFDSGKQFTFEKFRYCPFCGERIILHRRSVSDE